MTRPRRPALKSTRPARAAKIVSSLPIPAPSPGLKRVPRWRTMISPPVTTSPANTFTPRRWAFESRPLREEPRPFLCAMADLRDLDAGQVLPVPGRALVAPLGLELEDADLVALLVTQDLRADLDLLEAVGVEHGVIRAEQDRLELHGGALIGSQLLDEQVLTLLDAVLLASGFHDCIHVLLAGALGLGTGTAPSTSAATAPGR